VVPEAASHLFPVAADECFACDHPCAEYPEAIAAAIDQTSVMYGTLKKYDEHILIATGKTDWNRDIESVSGTLAEAFAKEGIPGLKISNSNLPPPAEYYSDPSQPTDVWLVSQFVKVLKVRAGDVSLVRSAFLQPNPSPSPPMLTSEALRYDAVVMLCSHRSRDKKCGVTAPIIMKALQHELRERDLLRDFNDSREGGVVVTEISHVGGHRWAANVVIYRREPREAIWLARVTPQHAKGIVEQTILQGKVAPGLLRGGYTESGKTSW